MAKLTIGSVVVLGLFLLIWWHQAYLLTGAHVVASWWRASVETTALLQEKLVKDHEDKEFNLQTLDLSVWRQCGKRKCFFPAKEDPTMGYLAVLPEWMESLEYGYQRAVQFEKKYNASHFMLGKPRLANISLELSLEMDKKRWNPCCADRPPDQSKPNTTASNPEIMRDAYFFNHTVVAIQKARRAPTPHIFLKRSSSKPIRNDNMHRNFKQFLQDQVQDKVQFAGNFDMEMSKLWILLKNEPYFNVDFQILVDAHGYAYLIDFDTYGRSPESYIKGNKVMFGKFQEDAQEAAKEQIASSKQKV